MRGVFLAGRRLIGRTFLASFLVLLLGTSGWAQTVAVQNGLGWLAGSQSSDGSWPSAEVTDLHATTEALQTLTLLSPANSSLATGRAWLATQDTSPTDFLARRILIEVGAGLDVSSQVNELLALRATSGGWGGDEGFANNNLDTALALQALKAANHADLTVLNPALAYLVSTQKADGGWGFYSGDTSSVYMTAVVSATLQQFPQTTAIATAVSKATAYLLANQNADGGFGNAGSTVYETALSYVALVVVSADAVALGNAVNQLAATQAANGSWNDDAYSTALALKALYLSENHPSPPPPPPASGTFTGTVIDTTTNLRLSGVAVVLGSDALINTTTDNMGNFTLRDVPPGSQQVSLSLAGYQSVTVPASATVNETVSLGTIKLVSGYSTGTIAGTITDPAGKPLSGVAVTVAGAWSGTAITGADGSYQFTFVTPGEVAITAAKAGFENATGAGTVYARTTLTFSPRLSATPSQVATGTLTGRVIDSRWGVPIDHLPGEPGVTVMLAGSITASPDPNNRGLFEIQDLAPGTYQVVVGMKGYTTQTFRVVISPGVTTDLGTIRLATTISKMLLTGKVTDAVTGAPIRGAAISIQGTAFTGRTDSSGTYAIADINHPSTLTVRATAAGYTGKSLLIRTQPWTQTMNIAMTPRDENAPPTGSEVGVSVQSDKATYLKSDRIGLTVNLLNMVGQDYPATLHVTVTDPLGGVVLDTTQAMFLAADATIWHAMELMLPLSAPGGTYTAQADMLDANSLLLGSGTKTFGVTTSQITVVPKLPTVLTSDATAIDFTLSNIGTIAVTNGLFDATLTDPDGEVVATTSQPFALGLGENTTLTMPVTIPPLKFGNYTLSYRQSDATVAGAPTELAVPNVLTVKALFDENSHRIRSTAGLTVTLVNDGLFTLDPGGAGLPVTVSVPDADYVATKTLLPLPAMGNPAGSALLYQFVLPETLSAGMHPATVTVTLPSGSTLVQETQLAILESSLTLSPIQGTFTAGGAITPVISNSGGVDTPVNYTLTLLDAKAVQIAEATGTEMARAGESLGLTLAVPNGAVDGSYQVIASFLDTKTGKEQIISSPVTIIGVKGTLQSWTDKDDYLATENITALSTLTNSGTPLQDGNLHLQVTTTEGTKTQKIWTTREDFQAGSRNGGVDTYGVNDWIVPEDEFEGTAIDTSRWTVAGAVSMRSNKAYFNSTVNQASLTSNWVLEGDFDIQVDYSASTSANNQGPQLQVVSGDFYATVHNNFSTKYTGDIVVNGDRQYYATAGSFSASGKLRLKRVNDTITTYYGSGSTWTEINHASSPQLTSPCQVVLKVWRNQSYTTGASAEFNNFMVNSGRILTQNQTVGSVRLLPLNDNFDDGVWNTDRWTGKIEEGFGSAKFLSTSTTDSSLYHRILVTGDFFATAVFKNYSATPAATDDGRFLMYARESTNYNTLIYFNRWSWAIGEKLNSMSRINGVEDGDQIIYSNDSGRLRLRRAGTVAYSDYWDGGIWKNLHSRSSFPTTSLELGQYTTTRNNYPTITTELDSYTLNKGIYATSGIINIKHDSGNSGTRWGKILFSSTKPSGTSLKFRTRSADEETNLANAVWSDYITTSGVSITNPAARWIEVEATLTTTNPNVTPLLHDLTVTYETKPGEVLWQADVPVDLASGVVSELSHAIGTLGVTGKLYLNGELISSTGQTVASSGYPFFVESGDFSLLLATDKAIYRPGETVTVSGEVRNRSTVDAANLALRIEDPGAAGADLFTENFDLPAQSSHPLTFTTIAGTGGVHALYGTVKQNTAILAEVSGQYEVASPDLAATLAAPDAAGNEPFAIAVTLNNSGKVDAAMHVRVMEGNAVVGVEDITVPAGETRLLQYTHQIVSDTQVMVEISGDLSQTLSHPVAYVAPSVDNTVTATFVTDQAAYDPNDLVALTATVTARSQRENLSALITIVNGQGQALHAATMAIPVLVQGQTLSLGSTWNVGSTPAGSYLATLQVLDAAGTVMTSATRTLTINAVSDPRILLSGRIALDRQGILSGESMTVSYGATNIGNSDLTDIALTIQTVTLADQAVLQTIADQTTLAMGASYANSRQLDTQGFSAGDYLVILRARINGVEETLGATYFRVEGAPTAPALVAPANGADVVTLKPTFIVSNAVDPNDEPLSYDFEIYSDSGLISLAATGTVDESATITAWLVDEPLVENQTYFWRARASDGWLYGPWQASASFRVNTVDDPPLAPHLSSPADGTSVTLVAPTLTVTNATDPDSSVLTYNVDLAHDPAFTQVVASGRDLESGSTTTSWPVPLPLNENGWYYWRAQANDLVNVGPWSATAAFLVNTANDPPSMPVIVAPVTGTTLAALATNVTVSNATDPDSPMLSYVFEADTLPTFDSPNLIRSEAVAEGQGGTSWFLDGLLDNSWYSVRVKASDGQAESPWSPVVTVFANPVNDPPAVPVLDNPSDGAGVTSFTPTLSVHNATDLDGNPLTYEFVVSTDPALTNLVAHAEGVPEAAQITAWVVSAALTENQVYYWSARAFDGALHSDWMPAAAFLVNTANDAPGSPTLLSPADQGVVSTLTPVLTVANATDPDNDGLHYDFEIYGDWALVASFNDVPEGEGGKTSVTVATPLDDNRTYTWWARAFDGERYGQWMNMATFTTRVQHESIPVSIQFDPDTLNLRSKGQWVTVTILLPPGYRAADVDLTSLRLEGTVPAEPRPVSIQASPTGDELVVKFARSEVVKVLPVGEQVSVQVTGTIATVPLSGVDVIRVIDK